MPEFLSWPCRAGVSCQHSWVWIHSTHLGRFCLKIKQGTRRFDKMDMFLLQRLVLKGISFRNFLLRDP